MTRTLEGSLPCTYVRTYLRLVSASSFFLSTIHRKTGKNSHQLSLASSVAPYSSKWRFDRDKCFVSHQSVAAASVVFLLILLLLLHQFVCMCCAGLSLLFPFVLCRSNYRASSGFCCCCCCCRKIFHHPDLPGDCSTILQRNTDWENSWQTNYVILFFFLQHLDWVRRSKKELQSFEHCRTYNVGKFWLGLFLLFSLPNPSDLYYLYE